MGQAFNKRNEALAIDRLEYLLSVNAQNAARHEMFRSDREMLEANAMVNPITMERSYARFGFMLGSIPTSAIFLRILGDVGNFRLEDSWFFLLFLLAGIATAGTGYFTGRFAARAVRHAANRRLSVSLSLLPLIGLAWGLVSGALGGSFILLIGAFFGGIIGAVVGMTAVPIFAILHNAMRRGDLIEQKHFLPIALGVTFFIAAFILGL